VRGKTLAKLRCIILENGVRMVYKIEEYGWCREKETDLVQRWLTQPRNELEGRGRPAVKGSAGSKTLADQRKNDTYQKCY
jgi:hypothetical protein